MSDPDFVNSIRQLGPLLRAEADAAEEARQLTPSVVSAMHQAGIFRMFVPRSLGGDERLMSTGLAAIEELGRCDGAAAWVAFVVSGGPFVLSRLADAGAEEIFSGHAPFVCGSLVPPGTARTEPGGFRLDGRWTFVSGCRHATAFAFAGLVPSPASSAPTLMAFAVPAAEAEVLDTWRTGGLRATGSHDVAVSGCFVPRHRVCEPRSDAPRSRHHQGPLYRFPWYGPLGTGISAVALGIARGAIDAFVEMAAGKSPVGRVGKLREQAAVQSDVAKAFAAVGSARAWLYETVMGIEAVIMKGDPVRAEMRRNLVIASTHATQAAAEAVDRMHLAGGGSAIYTANPLDRAFRDVHAATQHRRTAPIQYEIAGRMMLGLDPGDAFVWL